MRSPENIVAEIEGCIEQYGAKHYRFVDDTFVVKKQWVSEVSSHIQERGLDVSFDVLSRADLMSDEMASDLKSMGVRRIYFGMESGSDEVLKRMSKRLTAAKSVNATATVRRHGMEFLSWIMLGYPGETKEDIYLTRDMLVKIKPDILSISIAFPIRDTPFYDEVEDRIEKKRPLWRRTGENRLVFDGQYPRTFYRFAQRWIYKEVDLAKGVHKPWTRPAHHLLREFLRLKVLAGAEVYAALLERFRDRLTVVDQPLYERAVYEIQASLKKDREVGTQRGRLGGPSVFYRALRLPFIVFAKWMERRRRGLYPGGLIYSNSRVVRSHFRRFWVDVPPDPDGNLAAEAFSRIADDYEHRVVASSSNLHMRGIVRQKLDGFVRPGARVLDLGTGTGTDAIWLARRGASVLAVDVAEGMVREASQRVDEAGVQDRVEVRRLAIEELRTLLPGHARKYDLVLANFGALNLAGDPERWAPVIARLLKPGGYLVANVMNRWCAWEIFAGLLRGRFRFALRRARGDTIRIGDVPLSAALYTPRSFARRLGPYFDTRSRTGLCVFAPPPALEHVGRASPGLGRGLAWLDHRLGRWPGFRGLGNHFLMVLQQRSRPVFNYRTRAAITASPVVADVNGDGSPETVVATGRLHILHRQGGNMRLRQ